MNRRATAQCVSATVPVSEFFERDSAISSMEIPGWLQTSRRTLANLCGQGTADNGLRKYKRPGRFSHSRWSADGQAILYFLDRGQTSSLWSQSLDGGAPKQLADFSPEQIFSFDLSRDGKWLAFARGTIIRDVILITDTNKQ